MKLLMLCKDLNPRQGWGRYSLELIRALRDTGVTPEILTGRKAEPVDVAGVRSKPVLYSLTESGRLAQLAWIEALRFRGAARAAGLIHAMDETALPLAYSLSKLTGRPFLATIHGTYCIDTITGPHSARYRRMFAAAAGIVAVSHYTRGRFLDHMPDLADRVRVVPLGVDPALIDEAAPPVSEREPILLNVGAVKPRKGALQIVRALAALGDAAPGTQLVLAGQFDPEARYIAEVRAEAERLGVTDRVNLLGEVDEAKLNALYRSARILVMPSQNVGTHFEGFGLVHLEAAAMGLPAIGSLGCGNEDAIRDGQTGYLVAQDDPAQLGERISRLLTDDALWSEFSRAGLGFAKEMDWSRVAGQTRAFIDDIVGKAA